MEFNSLLQGGLRIGDEVKLISCQLSEECTSGILVVVEDNNGLQHKIDSGYLA